MSKTMPFDDLERVYESLAHSIDRVGLDHEAVFLTKLVLTLAHKLADVDAFNDALRIAETDL